MVAIVAGLIAIFAIIPYILDTVRGKTKPNVVSWFTWTLLLGVATAGAFASDEPRTAFLSLGDFIGTGITLLVGIKYGFAKFSLFDGLCQFAIIAGLVLWLIFDSPAIAILAAIIIDTFAALPTLRHAWLKPNEETWQTFAILTFASCLTLLTLTSITFAGIAFPLYLLIINTSIAGTVVIRRKTSGQQLHPGA